MPYNPNDGHTEQAKSSSTAAVTATLHQVVTDALDMAFDESHPMTQFNVEGEDMLPVEITGIESFEVCGVLTTDEGFVLDTLDGRQYQVTVVRSL